MRKKFLAMLLAASLIVVNTGTTQFFSIETARADVTAYAEYAAEESETGGSSGVSDPESAAGDSGNDTSENTNSENTDTGSGDSGAGDTEQDGSGSQDGTGDSGAESGTTGEDGGGSATDSDGSSATDSDGSSATDSDGSSATDSDGSSATDSDGGTGTDSDGSSGTDSDGSSTTDSSGESTDDEEEIPVTDIEISTVSTILYTSGRTLPFSANVSPSDAGNRDVIWSSSNTAVATVSSTGVVTGVKAGIATITATAADGSGVYDTCRITVKTPVVYYSAKVIGRSSWNSTVNSGYMAGTTGQSLIMEAMRVKLVGDSGTSSKLGIEYRVHRQTTGWESTWSSNWGEAGAAGSGKRLEAVQIRLTGVDKDKYDIYYCLHVQNFGWLNWAKNGEMAGSSGLSRRVEAFRIRIVPKGSSAPAKLGTTSSAYVKGVASKSITVSPASVTLKVGGTSTIKYTITPSNATLRNYNQTWSSSNTAVATVTSKGVITAKAIGTCTITVKTRDGRATAKVKVTVK